VRVFRLVVKDAADATRMVPAAKMGRLEEIYDEKNRYNPEVTRLPVGTYAPLGYS
jgi:hypothetical protein